MSSFNRWSWYVSSWFCQLQDWLPVAWYQNNTISSNGQTEVSCTVTSISLFPSVCVCACKSHISIVMKISFDDGPDVKQDFCFFFVHGKNPKHFYPICNVLKQRPWWFFLNPCRCYIYPILESLKYISSFLM